MKYLQIITNLIAMFFWLIALGFTVIGNFFIIKTEE